MQETVLYLLSTLALRVILDVSLARPDQENSSQMKGMGLQLVDQGNEPGSLKF